VDDLRISGPLVWEDLACSALISDNLPTHISNTFPTFTICREAGVVLLHGVFFASLSHLISEIGNKNSAALEGETIEGREKYQIVQQDTSILQINSDLEFQLLFPSLLDEDPAIVAYWTGRKMEGRV
jgi:hypothetical protein